MWSYPWGGMPHARAPTRFCVQGLVGSLVFAFAFEPLPAVQRVLEEDTAGITVLRGVGFSATVSSNSLTDESDCDSDNLPKGPYPYDLLQRFCRVDVERAEGSFSFLQEALDHAGSAPEGGLVDTICLGFFRHRDCERGLSASGCQ